MEQRRLSRRSIQRPALDSGMETRVFGHKVERLVDDGEQVVRVAEHEGKTVLKNYNFKEGSPLVEGFNEKLRAELEEHYVALCKQYGQKFFPRQRFLRLAPHPHDKKRERQFALVQQRLQLADPADVMAYRPGQLPESARVLVEELVAKRKASYEQYLNNPADKTNRALDLIGHANVVLCEDGTIKYLDTSSKRGRYSEVPFHIPVILGTTAILEIVSGRDPKTLLEDPFYRVLVLHKKFAPVAKLVNTPEPFLKRLRQAVDYDLYDEAEDERSNQSQHDQRLAI